MPPVAIALALGLGLLALGMGSKDQHAQPSPVGGPKTLDPGMPPELDAGVRQLLKTSTRPDDLENLAVIADARGYHNTAAALRARAAQLRGQVSVPSVPLPSAGPSPTPSALPGFPGVIPIPLPTEPGTPAPMAIPVSAPAPLPPMPPAPAPPPIEDIDANIPPDLAQSVAAILAKPDLTDQDLAYAEQLANRCEQQGFVRAAAKLRAKTLAIRASHAGSTLLQQIATVITAPPGSLPPLPVQLPGIPPIATTPGPVPAAIPIPVSPPVAPPGASPPVAPLAKTYKVVQGDNPSKIAQRFTGSSAATRVRELAAANPDKSGRILAGTIYVGETLTIPDGWPAKPGYPVTTPTPSAPPAPAPITAPHSTIQKGSTGPDVALWQTLIGTKADGIFGPNTDAATRTWQAGHGLPPDGIVGPLTWSKALTSFTTSAVPSAVPFPSVIPGVTTIPVSVPAPAAPPPTPHAQIGLGSSGPDVVAWQKIVGVPADGKFGPQTQAATRAWQSAHGLTPDGIVGPKTWAAAVGTPSASAGGAYVVGPGDTPFKIARRFTGDGNRLIELALTNPSKALRIAQGTLEHGEPLYLPQNWPATAGVYEPDAAAGVMDIIGATHHGHHHHNGMGSHRHHR